MRHLHAAIALLFCMSGLARATTPDYEALDIHALLTSMTDAQLAELHIADAHWQTATTGVPVDHAYILGSLNGEGHFNPDGSLKPEDVLPAVFLIRVPAVWNGRVMIFAPGGAGSYLILPFQGFHAPLMQEGYAFAVIYHALPGGDRVPGVVWPYEQYIDKLRTHDQGAAMFALAHRVKDVLGVAFARPRGTYMMSQSGGVLFGSGLIVGRPGNPIDGYVMGVGGNGWRTEVEAHVAVYGGDRRVPLTNQLITSGPTLPLAGAELERAANLEIGLADPEYRNLIMNGGGHDAFVAYRIADRPRSVMRAWDDLGYGADLQAPVIVLQGTADTTQYVRNSLVFTKRVIHAGRTDRLRLYIGKGLVHMGWTNRAMLDAFHELVSWVEDGELPGTIHVDDTLSVDNNWDTGFANDPCGYFHHQFDPDVTPPAPCGL
jgi:hypothetical protein